MWEINLERVNLKNQFEKDEIEIFLNEFDLVLDVDVTYAVIYRVNGEVKATASIAGNILKCFAISREYRGTQILGELVNNLMDRLFEQGIYHSFIFTRPDKITSFIRVGYKLVYKASEVALLENGIYDIKRSLKKFIEDNNIDTDEEKMAILICNNEITQKNIEFIKDMSRKDEKVLLFSTESIEDNENKVISKLKLAPQNEYLFSYNSFPKYFIKEEAVRAKAFKELILGIFNEYFFYSFNIKKLYVCEGI
jgi:[citrate (pro-3S)-lyase] ligase